VDPSGPDAQQLIALLNQTLSKIHLSVPPANRETEADGEIQDGEDSPGGFQATVTKDPDTRAGDFAVNDDDTHTVSALEAVFYNDGTQGRNRVVLQLAGVEAESRYGIHEVPDFGSFDEGPAEEALPGAEVPEAPAAPAPPAASAGEDLRASYTPEDTPAAAGEPLTYEEILDDIVPAVATQPVFRPGGGGFVDRLPGPLQAPARVLRDAIRLLVNQPAQFGLLFATFALLAAPLYLAYRRRSFARALIGGS
jgi:hypothetical protein